MVVGRGAAVRISALWSVHTGDQGPPPSQAHSLWALVSVSLFSEQMWLWVLRVDSPTAWLAHSLFS